MMVALFIFLVVVVVIGGLLFAYWSWKQEQKRRAAFQALCAAEGWRFVERDSHERPERYRAFEPFGQGHSRYAYNIMIGRQDDGDFELFDYHYAVTTRNGKNQSTTHYHHRVCALEMPLAAPDLLIRDEHLGHKLFDALGGEDIDFESHEFSRRFWVRCRDRRFAYDVVHPTMMEFLLGVPGWTWQWKGHTLLLFQTGRMRPEDVKSFLGMALRFRRLLPRHLVAHAPAVSR